MGSVYVVGSVNTDLVVRTPRLPAAGETVVGEAFATYGGGKGANQAIAAARMGAHVMLVGAVGDDPYSEQRLADLVRDDVEIEAVARRAGVPGGVALILVAQSGENAITIVPGANGTVTPAEVEAALSGRLRPGDVVCAQLEVPVPAVRAAMAIGRAAQATTVLNATPFTPDARELLDLVDILVVNDLEARQLAGLEGEEAPPAHAVERLQQLGVDTIVVTLGSQGALFVLREQRFRVPAPEVQVVDTTAAGDAFIGALVALLAEGQDWGHLAPCAVWAGALAVQRAGAQPSLPRRAEVEEAVRKMPLVVEPVTGV